MVSIKGYVSSSDRTRRLGTAALKLQCVCCSASSFVASCYLVIMFLFSVFKMSYRKLRTEVQALFHTEIVCEYFQLQYIHLYIITQLHILLKLTKVKLKNKGTISSVTG